MKRVWLASSNVQGERCGTESGSYDLISPLPQALGTSLTHPYLAGHGYAGVRVDISGCSSASALGLADLPSHGIAQLKMDINWKAIARMSNSLLSFHSLTIYFMRLYVRQMHGNALLSVSFIFAIVPIDALNPGL
jgi:hypothetical protein